MGKDFVKLQVLICTYGEAGIKRIADSNHPKVEGVEYIISWQDCKNVDLPESLRRSDIIVIKSATKGLCINRNIALSKASAPFALIADDDLTYTAQGLLSVIKAFEENPEMDVISFCYECKEFPPHYPAQKFSLNHPPKGYHPVSFELAVRTSAIAGKIRFNENFGIGALFGCGEETLFLHEVISNGHKGIHLPIVVATHYGSTTGDRESQSRNFIATKGAVFYKIFPFSWPLRMLTHAFRNSPHRPSNMIRFCNRWLSGVRLAKRHRVFK